MRESKKRRITECDIKKQFSHLPPREKCYIDDKYLNRIQVKSSECFHVPINISKNKQIFPIKNPLPNDIERKEALGTFKDEDERVFYTSIDCYPLPPPR